MAKVPPSPLEFVEVPLPASSPSPENGGEDNLPLKIGLGLLCLLLLAVGGLGGFYLARKQNNSNNRQIYSVRYKQGYQAGSAAVLSTYRPGEAAYQKILRLGQSQQKRSDDSQLADLKKNSQSQYQLGLDNGYQRGYQLGLQDETPSFSVASDTVATPQAEGSWINDKNFSAIDNYILGGFANWETGSYYLVSFNVSANGIYSIGSQLPISQSTLYQLCAEDQQEICQANFPNPPANAPAPASSTAISTSTVTAGLPGTAPKNTSSGTATATTAVTSSLTLPASPLN